MASETQSGVQPGKLLSSLFPPKALKTQTNEPWNVHTISSTPTKHENPIRLWASDFLSIFSPSDIRTLSVCLSLSLFHSHCAISFSPLYYLSLLFSIALILSQIEGEGGGGLPILHSLPKIYFCLCSLTLLGQKHFIKTQGKKTEQGSDEFKPTGAETHTQGHRHTNTHTYTAAREESHEQKDHLLHAEKGVLRLWPRWTSAVLAPSQHSQPARRIPPPAPMPCCPLTAKDSLAAAAKKASIFL